MIPIRDENPTTRPPLLTIALMAVNVLVYLFQFSLSPPAEQLFVFDYGLVPAWLTGAAPVQPPPDFIPRPLTLLTSMFLHGGLLHLAGTSFFETLRRKLNWSGAPV